MALETQTPIDAAPEQTSELDKNTRFYSVLGEAGIHRVVENNPDIDAARLRYDRLVIANALKSNRQLHTRP